MNAARMTPHAASSADATPAFRSARRLAGGLLLGMTGGLVLVTALPAFHVVRESGLLRLLRAGFQAGMVGGIADWFAVTALFRHPLGLPIPHTAILPRQKARLGQGLGRFVAGQFFTEDDVTRAIARVGVPDMLAEALRNPENRAALIATVQRALPPIVVLMESGRATCAIRKALPVLLQGEDAARLVARSLRALVDSELHQEVLTFLLARIKHGIHAREPLLRQFIEDRVREQGGRVLGWAIGAGVASRVLTALNMELERIDPSDSSLREGFTNWARQEIDRIEDQPSYRSRLVEAVSGVFTHASLQAWLGELWLRVRDLLIADLGEPQGWSAAVIDAAIEGLAEEFATDETMRRRIEQGTQIAALRLLPTVREMLSHYIAAVVDRWDEVELADRLEQRVGRDLQYIRVNGTLVGFLIGATLDGAARLFFGSLP
ncbi:DUF445 domain-containing protein [Acidomonas methanolica]|uniref:DUF445 domain-containing protein n=1 Tax=Acidomonas methanolica TaxID=437 RepID=UPI00211A1E44|nr:DUF445 domain-containing protein [Acidomonas methanolica]